MHWQHGCFWMETGTGTGITRLVYHLLVGAETASPSIASSAGHALPAARCASAALPVAELTTAPAWLLVSPEPVRLGSIDSMAAAASAVSDSNKSDHQNPNVCTH